MLATIYVWVRRSALVLLAGSAMLLSGCEQEPQLRVANGSTTQLSSWQGNWVLINYWADWCGPCREEVPELNRLHADGKTQDLTVYGVNYDMLEGAELAASASDLGIEFPNLLDDPQIMLGFAPPEVLPTTVILTPQGQVHKVLIGPQDVVSLLASMPALQASAPTPRLP